MCVHSEVFGGTLGGKQQFVLASYRSPSAACTFFFLSAACTLEIIVLDRPAYDIRQWEETIRFGVPGSSLQALHEALF